MRRWGRPSGERMSMNKSDDDVLIRDARDLARKLLRKSRSGRWLHTQGVAGRASELAGTVRKPRRTALIVAAWLHDIGYAPDLRETGFPPLDGALYLQEHDWDDDIVDLVAHHTGARLVPVKKGVRSALDYFDFGDSDITDALTYANLTVSARGKRMKVADRLADAHKRHGTKTSKAQREVRDKYLLEVAGRVESRLAALKRK